MWKDFLRLHFAVDQVPSISGYDLENGRYDVKNNDFDFAPLFSTLLTFSCLYCSCKLF